MKEIDEENKNMIKLKTQSSVINGKLKETKDNVKRMEDEIIKQKEAIKEKEASIANSKKQQIQAQKGIEELAKKIRILESEANRSGKSVRVSIHHINILIGSCLH